MFIKSNNSIIKLLLVFSLSLSVIGCSNLDIHRLNNKAAELMQQGDIDGAIARLESIQALNPNFPQTNYNLGIAYKEKGQFDNAVKYLDKAITLKPGFYQAHISLAVVYEELADQLKQFELEKQEKDNPDLNKSFEEIEISVDQKEKLINFYTKAKENSEAYLKFAGSPEDKEMIEAKIKEYSSNIDKYSANKEKADAEQTQPSE